MEKMCNGCGLCCRLFYINLSEEEYFSGKYATILGEHGTFEKFDEAESCGANLLEKKEDGSCIYLEGNLCGVHNDRPEACADFFCTSDEQKFEEMIEMIKVNDVEKISSIFE